VVRQATSGISPMNTERVFIIIVVAGGLLTFLLTVALALLHCGRALISANGRPHLADVVAPGAGECVGHTWAASIRLDGFAQNEWTQPDADMAKRNRTRALRLCYPKRMKHLLIAVPLFFISTLAAAQEAPMSVTFSFGSAKDHCTGYFESPEIRLQNVPAAATSATITLTQKGREMGGQEVPLPRSRIVPAGAVNSMGPCNPGVYRYDVTVKSSLGQDLATAGQSRTFPRDEMVE